MFGLRGSCFCLIFLMLIASGCSEMDPIAAENTNTPNTNDSDSSAAPSLAPLLPQQQAPLVPVSPNQNGLVAFDSAAHDFGEVKQKTELQHDFVLTNNINVPIRIVGMESSCSCTWSESNDNFVGSTIEPKQKIDFPVFINTGTMQDTATGRIKIVYRYQSDNPKWKGEDTIDLEVRATILPDYRIDPIDLSFGEIRALETQNASRKTPVSYSTGADGITRDQEHSVIVRFVFGQHHFV